MKRLAVMHKQKGHTGLNPQEKPPEKMPKRFRQANEDNYINFGKCSAQDINMRKFSTYKSWKYPSLIVARKTADVQSSESSGPKTLNYRSFVLIGCVGLQEKDDRYSESHPNLRFVAF